MKKARILFLLLAGVLLLAGCQKEGKIGGKDAIRFTASSNPGTKTEYTGVYDGGIERIYWNMDDPIRIFTSKAGDNSTDIDIRDMADDFIPKVLTLEPVNP